MTVTRKIHEYILSHAMNKITVKEIRLTPKDWAVLLLENGEWTPPLKPKPPIKSFGAGSGFFSSWEEIVYDYHAPEYLEALKVWEIQCKEFHERHLKIIKELNFVGPFGVVKLKKSEKSYDRSTS